MLSILIPSYNHSSLVIEAIASARCINAKGKQIYIIDDASTDDSVEVVERYLREVGDENITFLKKSINKGAVDSVLIFLSLCKTEFVYFMASDDVVIAEGIEELLNRLEAFPSLAFIIGGGNNIFPNGVRSSIYTAEHDKFFRLTPKQLKKNIFLDSPSPILCQSSVFRLNAIYEVGGFDRSITADDFALFARLFQRFNRRGIDFDFLPLVNCILYRHHEMNSYRNLLRQAKSDRQVLNALAPDNLRNRATGYNLAFYTLVAIKNLDLNLIGNLLFMIRLQELFWFFVGLFSNALAYITRR